MLFRSGSFEAALTKYSEALEASPQPPSDGRATLLSNRAAASMALNRLPEALADLTECLAANPQNVKAVSRLYRVHLALGDVAAAGKLVRDAFSAASDAAGPARDAFGALRTEWSRLNSTVAEAKAQLESLFGLSVSSGMLRLGTAPPSSSSSPSPTLQSLTASVSGLSPPSPFLNLLLAQLNLLHRRPRTAETLSASVVSSFAAVSSDDTQWRQTAALTRVHALIAVGRFEDAASAVSEFCPSLTELKAGIEAVAAQKAEANDMFRAKSTAEAKEKYAAAITTAESVLGWSPSVLHSNLGAAALSLGNVSEAKDAATAALSRDAFNVKALVRRAMATSKTDARGAWQDLVAAQYLAPSTADIGTRVAEAATAAGAPSAVVHVDSTAKWRDAVAKAGSRLIVADWYADWCGPCRSIAPTFEALAQSNSHVMFLKVNGDTDDTRDLTMDAGIRSFPTFQFFRDGKKVSEFKGADPASLVRTLTGFGPWPADVDVEALSPPSHLPVWPPQ